MNKLPGILLAATIALIPGVCNAGDKLFLTGAEVTDDSASYFYLGTSLPLPDSSLAKGYVFHLWADYLTYSYEAGITDVDAEVNSISASIGYHDSGASYWWNTRAGLIQSNTRLSPDDPDNDSSGRQTGVKLQIEGERQLTPDSKINGNLAFVSRRAAYWSRLRYLMRNNDDTYHGPEFIVQGDENYEALQLGWVLTEIPLGGGWDIGAKGGMRLENSDIAAYVGVELGVLY
jgi:hypothetical protein